MRLSNKVTGSLYLGIGMKIKGFLRSVLFVVLLGAAFAAQALGTATDDTATTTMNVAIDIDVTANDGTLGPTEGVLLITNPAHGTAVVTSGQKITYTPAAGYTGSDNFTYALSGTPTATAKVSVTVNPAPAISISLANATLGEGSEITLTPTVTGGAPELTYAWTIPVASQSKLEIVGSSTGKSVTVKGKEVNGDTTAKVQLTVTDSSPTPKTASIEVTISIKNVVAPMTPSITGGGDFNEGTTKTLTAAEGGGKSPYTYKWEITGGGGAVTIDGGTTGKTLKLKGNEVAADTQVTVKLTVTDSSLPKLTKTATATMKVKNVTAVFAPSISGVGDFNEGTTKTLTAAEGGGKSPYTYKWEVTGGAGAVTIDGGTTGKTLKLKGKEVAADTQVTVKLTVTDSSSPKLTKTATATMKVINVLKKPVANAGKNQSVDEGETVTLDGSASKDPDGTISKYIWTSVDDPTIVLVNADSPKPTFRAPRVGKAGKTLRFTLKVVDNDDQESDKVAQVTITVKNTKNDAPVPVIQSVESVKPGAEFFLDASDSSDPDGDDTIVSYKWTQDPWTQDDGSTYKIEILEDSGKKGRFRAPAVPATSDKIQPVVILTVTDEEGATSEVRQPILVTTDETLRAPVADAGEDISVDVGAHVVLDGSASHDSNADGFIVQYEWSQIGGTAVKLESADQPKASFVAPSSITPTQGRVETLEFKLTVTDNDSIIDTDTVKVNVGPNSKPIVDAGKDQVDVEEGATVTLSGTASDPDGTISKVEWKQIGGAADEQVVLSDKYKRNVSFVTPPVTGGKDALTLEFEFIARDNLGGVGKDTVKVTVKDNGITIVPDEFVPIRSVTDDEKPVGFAVQSGKIINLSAEKTPLNERNDQVGRPRRIPYGLFDFTLKVEKPGDSATVKIWVPDDLSTGYAWYKYDSGKKIWSEYGNVTFNGHEVLLTLTDGGPGDDDGKKNGFIHDPSGPGSEIAKERTRIEGSSGGGAWGWPVGAVLLGAGLWRLRRRGVVGGIKRNW